MGIKKVDRDRVKMWYLSHMPVIAIAEEFGITRQAVYLALKKKGVDTAKRGPIDVVCAGCGEIFERYRYRVRAANVNFCSIDCRIKWQKESEFRQMRSVHMKARVIIERYHQFEKGEIVAYRTKKPSNVLKNLMVFRCRSDYERWLRKEKGASPVWTGRSVIEKRKRKARYEQEIGEKN